MFKPRSSDWPLYVVLGLVAITIISVVALQIVRKRKQNVFKSDKKLIGSPKAARDLTEELA